jgi:hypothetical protein
MVKRVFLPQPVVLGQVNSISLESRVSEAGEHESVAGGLAES